MSSYFFHGTEEDAALIAPPPPEYIDFTQRRAVWEALGLRKHEMTVKDWLQTVSLLTIESQHRNKKKDS